MRRRTRLAAVGAVGIAALAMASPAMASHQRTVLRGSKPAWARPSAQHARVPARRQVDFAVYLRMRNAGAARALAREVSTPGSARYRHFLSNRQFARRFAPTRSTTRALVHWLRAHGLHVRAVSPNRSYVTGYGRARSIERAFHTRLALFRYRGHLRRAITRPVSLPRSLARHVVYVGGLSQAVRMRPTSTPADQPSPGFRNAPPCSTYWAQKVAVGYPSAYGSKQPWAPCGYTPSQLRGAYGLGAIRKGWDGAGTTVAITDAYDSPTLLHDANTYSSRHGLPTFGKGQFTDITPLRFRTKPQNLKVCGDWYGEQSLDVEAVHSMAPAARFVYSGANSCYDSDLLVALHRVVDANRAQIISNSWGSLGELGFPESVDNAYTELFVQATLKGIGVYYSSGDYGDEIPVIGDRQPDNPANNPFVTAVGGTSLAVGKNDNYLFETGWGTGRSVFQGGAWVPTPPGDWQYGGGGGTSRVWPEPWYQKRVVPRSLSHYFGANGIPTGGRVVPDVAAVGDPNTGMLVGQTQTFPNGVSYGEYRIGGTSLSSPLFAGMMAVADSQAGFRHGFANPAFYRLAGTSAFHDIVSPAHRLAVARRDYVNGVNASDGYIVTLRTLNFTGTLHTRPGYDDVTGVGTPHGPAFFMRLAAAR